VDGSNWRTPKWLEWVQIAWNAAVGVGVVVALALTHWGFARAWMAVALVGAGLPGALLYHVLAEREGRELPPN
jgi:hypothetical protein